ncbi:MAG: hydantoinase/oxoprolinase family protein [Syntrophaceae bacterium]|nr:hydantoinase/oxoprolinase family protein [Syntrophaceae bacterium]
MILGIDVGGTHTDAVLIDHLRVISKTKVQTDTANLLKSLFEAATALLPTASFSRNLERIVLSTTLSTNAIVQDKTAPVGMVLLSGPGLSPSLLPATPDTHFLKGYANHQGAEVLAIDHKEIQHTAEAFRSRGIHHAGVVGKFSPRNPSQEKAVQAILEPQLNHLSLGHRMSGHLNFPRRIATTRLNAALWALYGSFVDQVLQFARQLEITAPIYILKADGGTFAIAQSREFPVQTILSGPAASVMGIMTLAKISEDAIALDIGGTTTDIALFADGVPLFEPFGITLGEHKTLIRGFRTYPLGVGGDSAVRLKGRTLTVGPDREGPAAALGGPLPTPTDALVLLGQCAVGNREMSAASLAPLAAVLGLSLEETAKQVVAQTCETIAAAIQTLVDAVNSRPVYTLHEFLNGKRLAPRKLYAVGALARPLAKALGTLLGCAVCVPEHAEVANAIGAALSRTTAELTLLADTERRRLSIAEEGIQLSIPAGFTKEDAVRIGRERLQAMARQWGSSEEEDVELMELQEFNMVRGFATVGRNIRVKLQITPGAISSLQQGLM